MAGGQLKQENMREREERLEAEREVHEARQLTEHQNRAWTEWMPMIQYLKGPPAVSPQHMAVAMTKS
eukprot:3187630-Rhodomonas_salina.1